LVEISDSGWRVELGIGEERAIQYRGGEPIAARLRWPGGLEAGQVLTGVLTSRAIGSRRGRARFPGGEEALVENLTRDASEGAEMRFRVTRAIVEEASRVKLAQVRPTHDAECPAPSLLETLPDAREVRAFPSGDWDEIHAMGSEGIVTFPGGSLHFAPTPAMVMVDVDGHLPPRELALAAASVLARASALMGLGGMVGIDFPTLEAKADRKAVDAALEQSLADFDHERTAMNGFGFVQIVARFERPSLLHLVQRYRAGAAARLLLRRAEHLAGPEGQIELIAHPAVIANLTDHWRTELSRRTGKQLSIRSDPTLALAAPHAQLVPR